MSIIYLYILSEILYWYYQEFYNSTFLGSFSTFSSICAYIVFRSFRIWPPSDIIDSDGTYSLTYFFDSAFETSYITYGDFKDTFYGFVGAGTVYVFYWAKEGV